MIDSFTKKIQLIAARFALAMSERRVKRMIRRIDRLEGRIAREADLRPRRIFLVRLAEGHYMASVIERSQKPRRDLPPSRRGSRPCAIRVLSP